MGRILNVASAAAVALTGLAAIALSEPGFASDASADAAKPVLLLPTEQDQSNPVAVTDVAPQPATTAGTPAETTITPAVPQSAPKPVVDAAPRKASSLAALVAATPKPAVIDEELRCLAGAVYFESKSESLAGQLAVAHVVINRAKSGKFARSLCGVVYQKSQFSFVRGGKMPAINTGGKQWANALAIAQIARDGSWANQAPGALYFHATHVSPGWGRPRVAQIDNHIFYR